jgi:hypothetical protein
LYPSIYPEYSSTIVSVSKGDGRGKIDIECKLEIEDPITLRVYRINCRK